MTMLSSLPFLLITAPAMAYGSPLPWRMTAADYQGDYAAMALAIQLSRGGEVADIDGTIIMITAKEASNDGALQLTVSPWDEDSNRQASLVHAADEP